MRAAGVHGREQEPTPEQPEAFPARAGRPAGPSACCEGLSLRQVEDTTDKAVPNAYLSQLEKGRIQKPSPHVLHSLAAVYAVPYERLMEKAGYLLPSEDKARGAGAWRPSRSTI